MNNIRGIYSNGFGGPDPIRPQKPAGSSTPQAAAPPGAAPDQVEISPIAQLLHKIAQLPDIRAEQVEQIRQQIAAGGYETPEKLSLALDRLLEEYQTG